MRLHNRQVKSTFWTDTDLIKLLDIPGRMFYLGLWQLADDSGCLYHDILAFKIQLFPADNDITMEVIEGWVNKLIDAKKIIPYEAGDKKCLFIKNFHKHQTLKNCSPPEVPLPPWIKWEPYSSNERTGKYVVIEDVLTDFLQSSYKVLTPDLQSSSNLNLNLNLNNIKNNILQNAVSSDCEPEPVEKPAEQGNATHSFDLDDLENIVRRIPTADECKPIIPLIDDLPNDKQLNILVMIYSKAFPNQVKQYKMGGIVKTRKTFEEILDAGYTASTILKEIIYHQTRMKDPPDEEPAPWDIRDQILERRIFGDSMYRLDEKFHPEVLKIDILDKYRR